MTGNGVTFYFASSTSQIQMNGQINIDISAPTSGTYENILIYEPTGLSETTFVVNSMNGHNMDGIIYMPSRNIHVNAVSSTGNTDVSTIVARTMIVNSQSRWNIDPLSNTNSNNNNGSGGGGGLIPESVRLTS